MNTSAHPNRTVPRPTLVDEAERSLRSWLAAGYLRRGDRLLPEHDLAAHLGVSRGTLRTALQRLERTGEVVRRQGSGTFVGNIEKLRTMPDGIERLTPYSRLAELRGEKLRARDVAIEEMALEADLAMSFEVQPGEQTVSCSRVLVAGGSPRAFMLDVLHPSIDLPAKQELRKQLHQGRMVLDVILDQGIQVVFSRTRIRATTVGPGEEIGRALGVEGITPLLELNAMTVDREGTVVLISSDFFTPGGIDLYVIRHLDAEEFTKVGPVPSSPYRSRSRRGPGRD